MGKPPGEAKKVVQLVQDVLAGTCVAVGMARSPDAGGVSALLCQIAAIDDEFAPRYKTGLVTRKK